MEEAVRALDANNRHSPLSVRANRPLEGAVDFRGWLHERGIKSQASPLLPNYVRVGPGTIQQLYPLLEQGELTVQDESAGLAVELLDPEPGDAILDLCAAPGGKTLAIYDRLRGDGSITANELSPERAEMLRHNLERVQAGEVEVTIHDARHFPDRLFDKVLVDAPCSALGLLRRQPDVRWRRRSHHLPSQTKEQIEILRRAAELVRPGGVLVYSTCSILPAENYDIIAHFLKEFPDYQREDARGMVPEIVVTPHGDMQTYTHIHDCDGAYAARLRRLS
jgi:16S rRNA (cytosine967-C5)-methyltransferase